MPSFPLVYLLLPFALVFALVVLFFFFNIFHLKRYAIRSRATSLVMLMYLASFGTLLLVTAMYLGNVDWSYRVTVTDILPKFGNVLERGL